MSTSTKKTIGIIGLGSIGMRHAKNLLALGQKVLGCDPNELALISLRVMKGHPIPYHDMMGAADAYVIASPTSEHWEQADNCMDMMGAPVFVEKPIGTKLHPKMKLIDMVGYNLRFHSCVKQARAWLEAGLIGQPLWANFTCAQYNAKPAYQRDGVILNWSHEIDLALYLLGPAKVAASSTRLTEGRDDITDILLTHDTGARSSIHLDYVTKPEQRGFTIGGSNGVIASDLLLRSIVRIIDGDRPFVYHDQGDSYDKNYVEEMQAFLDRIDGKKTIGATGQEGLDVLKICLEVREQAGLK